VALKDDDERFDWATASDPTDWAGEYATTEAKPDLARSMLVANQYLIFHGQNTIEPWRDDGSTLSGNCRARLILARLPATARPILTGQSIFLIPAMRLAA
jgi:hypothetical protein